MHHKSNLSLAVFFFMVFMVAASARLSYADGDSFTVNIPNAQGGYTAVVIQKTANGYLGPQGEYYPSFPSVAQLQVMYANGVPVVVIQPGVPETTTATVLPPEVPVYRDSEPPSSEDSGYVSYGGGPERINAGFLQQAVIKEEYFFGDKEHQKHRHSPGDDSSRRASSDTGKPDHQGTTKQETFKDKGAPAKAVVTKQEDQKSAPAKKDVQESKPKVPLKKEESRPKDKQDPH